MDHGGLLCRRDHPELCTQLDSALRAGELVSVLPGVYAAASVSAELAVRARAVMLWQPDAVICGRAAAALTFWPTMEVGRIAVAGVHSQGDRPGFAVTRRRVDPTLVADVGGLRLSTPALTVLDLCDELGGEPIDLALRTRAVTLRALHDTLEQTAGRRGNRRRRRLLVESRDEPWSAAERLAHVLLRSAGISGWRSNHLVVVGGKRFYLDIAFPPIRLAVEIDGREFHEGAAVFEADRHRRNALTSAGWRVLHVTWRMLQDDPAAVITAIRAELRR